MKKHLLITLMLVILIIPSIYASPAKSGHIPLLAVKESGDKLEGSLADLYLEIKPGTGRVFLETYPLSKLDTQISTRFAKEVACKYADADCTKYDFFYVITAESSIIGGPSAGAALSVLTISLLKDLKLNNDTVITGTINSGGLIGHVSGIKEKIDAASKLNVKRVLIPEGKRFEESENMTLDLQDYAKKYNINVIETGDLTEALYYFTGKRLKEKKEFIISSSYTDVMKSVAEMLCSRSEIVSKDALFSVRKANKYLLEIQKEAFNFTDKSKQAFKEKNYYSAASYCFSANVLFRQIDILANNITSFNKTKQDISSALKEVQEYKIKTITDMETYMIVVDRIEDSERYLNQSIEIYNSKKPYSINLAYAIERLYSVEAWKKFFGTAGKEYAFDQASLKGSCIEKISEAEELFQYVYMFFPNYLESPRGKIDKAAKESENGNYLMCLFKASNAKAEIDTILSAIGADEKNFDILLNNKMDVAKQSIREEQEKGIFPILGYSYYEYANSLKEEDKYSALLYSSYALELSNLDMYFKGQEKESLLNYYFNYYLNSIDLNIVIVFVSGLVVGFALSVIISSRKEKKSKSRKYR